LTGINRYRCQACAARLRKAKGDKQETEPVFCDATKQIVIRSLPQVLIVQIKRFLQSARGRLEKISESVDVPLVLNMMPYVQRGSPAAESGQVYYVLFGASEHSGSLSGGHYTATVNTGKDWYHCSDTCISRATVQRALSGSAYLLFYERRAAPPKESIPLPPPSPSEKKEEDVATQPTTPEAAPVRSEDDEEGKK
jgi:ubiquitin C-terminal hydrolase